MNPMSYPSHSPNALSLYMASFRAPRAHFVVSHSFIILSDLIRLALLCSALLQLARSSVLYIHARLALPNFSTFPFVLPAHFLSRSQCHIGGACAALIPLLTFHVLTIPLLNVLTQTGRSSYPNTCQIISFLCALAYTETQHVHLFP